VFGLIIVNNVENVFSENIEVIAAKVLALPQGGEGALANTQTNDGQREEGTDSDKGGGDGCNAQASNAGNSAILAVRLGQMEAWKRGQRRQFGKFRHLQLGLGILNWVVVVVITLVTGC